MSVLTDNTDTMPRTTTRNNSRIPDQPTHLSIPSTDFIDTVLFDVYSYPDDSCYAEFALTFNHGPHACSTGIFNLASFIHDPNQLLPVRMDHTTLGPTKSSALQTLSSVTTELNRLKIGCPDHIETALRNALETYTPNPTIAPGWTDRDNIPARSNSKTAPRTSNPRFLNNHPNLESTDDDTLGDYRIPNANTNGVAVHRHKNHDQSKWAVTGAGHDRALVSDIRVDFNAFPPATAPSTVGWFQRFYPRALLTVDADVAYITTDDDREWYPQKH